MMRRVSIARAFACAAFAAAPLSAIADTPETGSSTCVVRGVARVTT